MNWLENDELVKYELIPVVKQDINDWIEDNRYEDWFESSQDIDDFVDEQLPNELYELIENDIKEAIDEFGGAYNKTGCEYETKLDDVILENIIFENWDSIKNKYAERLYEKFNDDYSIYSDPEYDD